MHWAIQALKLAADVFVAGSRSDTVISSKARGGIWYKKKNKKSSGEVTKLIALIGVLVLEGNVVQATNARDA
jgi:hypothetical protein